MNEERKESESENKKRENVNEDERRKSKAKKRGEKKEVNNSAMIEKTRSEKREFLWEDE